ncbi:hypothetical protein NE237_005716 [Protea cynaroides]|uniref:Uncharacterized protein n=1 Tax=Protea cynaroides TaxID=273540 RepID=A0A9Q0KL46_9MAGN|nr:hypothetical protein NE237_005716 [Protea cynaroides]
MEGYDLFCEAEGSDPSGFCEGDRQEKEREAEPSIDQEFFSTDLGLTGRSQWLHSLAATAVGPCDCCCKGIGDAASTAGWPPRGNVVIRWSTLEGSVPDLKRFRTPQLLHSKSSGIWFWFSKSSGICLWFRRNSDLQEESSAMEDQTLETVFEKCDVISVHGFPMSKILWAMLKERLSELASIT